MPQVGDKKFAYTPEGMTKAREYAAKTGIPMEVKQRYNVGGVVKNTKGKQEYRGIRPIQNGGRRTKGIV
jgi:hypothetical protein